MAVRHNRPSPRRSTFEPLEQRCVLSTGYGTAFSLFTDDTLATPGLVGSYVDQSLRAVDETDWRATQTISGTRVDQVFFPTSSLGARAEVGVTGGSDQDWDSFSIQWDGVVQILEDNTTLATRSDDGSRMWIDLDGDGVFNGAGDELIDNNWGNGQGATVGPISESLLSGAYAIRIQFEEGSGGNSVSLIANPIQPFGEFVVYTDDTLATPGLTGSYVDQGLRGVDELDWRATQTIAGTRLDAEINFPSSSWGARADVGLTGGSDNDWQYFSVQWDGAVQIVQAGTTLATRSDDSSRMWIDINRDGVFDTAGGELVDNNWGNGQATTTGPSSAALQAGAYPIRIQYEEQFGGNVMQLVTGAPRMIRVAYLIPSNRSPQPSAVGNLEALMPRLQAWYREQMDRNGFGPKTFQLETGADGVTPKIHVVGLGVDDAFLRDDIWGNTGAAASAAGVRNWSSGESWLLIPEAHLQNPDGSSVGGAALGSGFGSGDSSGVAVVGSDFLFRSAADKLWDDRTYAGLVFPEFGPYPLVQNVSFPGFENSTVSSIASAAQGAIAHEMGHTFGLWHDGRNDNNYHGNVMGNGLRGIRGYAHPLLYPEDDMRLSYATALALNQSRYFNPNGTFSDNQQPTLAIQTSGSVATVDGLLKIDFTASDPSEVALALLRYDGNTIGEVALSGTSTSATFETPFYEPGIGKNYLISLYDTQGNRRDESVTINVSPPANRAPEPFISVFHSTIQVGDSLTLDASRTTDPDDTSDSLLVEWDLDGDGLFDTVPTTTKTLSTVLPERTHLVSARITDPSGAQAVSAPVAVRAHPLGDFDLDNGIGSGDLAMLQTAIAAGSPDPQFDLTGDGLLDEADVTDWLRNVLNSGPGDMDLDGDVDFDDFDDFVLGLNDAGAYAAIYGLPASTNGDTDGDGDLDFDDIDDLVAILSGEAVYASADRDVRLVPPGSAGHEDSPGKPTGRHGLPDASGVRPVDARGGSFLVQAGGSGESIGGRPRYSKVATNGLAREPMGIPTPVVHEDATSDAWWYVASERGLQGPRSGDTGDSGILAATVQGSEGLVRSAGDGRQVVMRLQPPMHPRLPGLGFERRVVTVQQRFLLKLIQVWPIPKRERAVGLLAVGKKETDGTGRRPERPTCPTWSLATCREFRPQ